MINVKMLKFHLLIKESPIRADELFLKVDCASTDPSAFKRNLTTLAESKEIEITNEKGEEVSEIYQLEKVWVNSNNSIRMGQEKVVNINEFIRERKSNLSKLIKKESESFKAA